MSFGNPRRPSALSSALVSLLNPIPYGCFAAALLFDLLYADTAVMLWNKGAAWLILFGLLFAIVPRLINLVQVWFTARSAARGADTLDFWLNLVAIVAAIVNAFVHSRDAFAIVPLGPWLSALTVILLAVGRIVVGVRASQSGRLAS